MKPLLGKQSSLSRIGQEFGNSKGGRFSDTAASKKTIEAAGGNVSVHSNSKFYNVVRNETPKTEVSSTVPSHVV